MKNFGKIILSFFFFFYPLFSFGAILGVSPATGNFKSGETFSVYLVVNSQNQSINAISLNLTFPNSLLKVLSVSKTDSIINYWVQEPSFSNSSGKISLEGVIINPGFNGSNGRVLKITFETKSQGIAEVNYSLSSVLANDGLGTNVLNSFSKASFTIGQTSAISTTPGVGATPSPIFVSSETHPDPNEWYSNKDLKLSWKIPSIVTDISYELDQTVSTNPGSLSFPKVSSFSRENLSDGVWFFHLRAKNENGWGAVSHFRIQVDTTPPRFVNIFKESEKEGKAVFTITSEDVISGIKNYEIRIDGDQPIIINGADKASFSAPILPAGEHTIFVRAFDFAGNHLANSIDFKSTGLTAPKLIEYPIELKQREILKIVGLSSPNTDIILTLVRQSQKRGLTEEIYYFSGNSKINLSVEKKLVKSGPDGIFRYNWARKIPAGSYRIYAIATDKSGNESVPSEQVYFDVLESKIVKMISYMTDILALIVPFFALLFILIFLLVFTKRKYKNLREGIAQELVKTEDDFVKVLRQHEDITKTLEGVKHKEGKTKEEILVLKEHEKDTQMVEMTIKQRILNLKKRLMGK